MSGEKYPFLEIGGDEENMLFSTTLQDQARIGHLRGDFGRGTEFWTTWWDRHEELKGQDFKDELDDLVNTLRKDGPLKDLSAMQKFCWNHPQARMSPEADSRCYAFRVDTDRCRFYLRCIPERGDYNFYLYCYRTEEFERDAPHPSFDRHGNAEKKRHRNGGER